MALPEIDLTAKQHVVLKPLLANLATAGARLKDAQRQYLAALEPIKEYATQAAEKLGVDVSKDYDFDLNSRKFLDKTVIAEAEAEKLAAEAGAAELSR